MASQKKRPCETVGKGAVGEPGPSLLLDHRVEGRTTKMMVLRTTASSLCPDTGAVGVLAVNGLPRAFGDLTRVDSTIQTEAAPGDHAVAIVHTLPLFNGIHCVRLGELEVGLESCELVGFTAGTTTESACVVSCAGAQTRGWYAWNNKMPPKPDDFHIFGEVEVANPGVDVELIPRTPPGINPKIISLSLVLSQRPGIWPQVLVWKQARYDKVMASSDYELAEIFCGDEILAKVEVENVH